MKFRMLLVAYLVGIVAILLLTTESVLMIGITLATLLFLSVLVYGVTTIKANFFMKSICQPPKGTVVLSFDDGPDPNYTPQVLQILKKYRIKALFFLIGKEVEQYPDLVKAIHQDGHVIGNHSNAHDLGFTYRPTGQVEMDLRSANEKLVKITGQAVRWGRPPFGITNPNIARAFARVGLISVGWNARPKDTNFKDGQSLLAVMKSKTSIDGSLILLHDRMPATVEVLEEYILWCKEKGMKFGTLSAS